MGRLRTKDFQLQPGWRRKNGRLYYQPTTDATRKWERKYSIPNEPMVYFIRAHRGAIKIGFTSSKANLTRRLSMLRVGSPQALLFFGAVPGSREDERRAHEALRLYRANGEWFGPHKAVTFYAKKVIREGRIPDELLKT